jgi:hypothetical protein
LTIDVFISAELHSAHTSVLTWCLLCCAAGKLDTFFVQAPDVGAISSIQLQCLGGGLTAAWHLSSVAITHSASGQVARFVYNDWFDKSKGWMQVGAALEPSTGHLSQPDLEPTVAVPMLQDGIHTRR